MIKPLALSFGYGLIFATVITLVLVPSFYYIAEDIKGLFARILGRFGFEINGMLYVSTGLSEAVHQHSDKEKLAARTMLPEESGEGDTGASPEVPAAVKKKRKKLL